MIERLRAFFQRKFVRDTLALQVGKLGTTAMTLVVSVLVVRLLRPEAYGTWALANSLLTIWQVLNLTGVAISTNTRLALAVGARDELEILNLCAFYVKVMLVWAVFSFVGLALLGPLLAEQLYSGGQVVGTLAAGLALTILPDALYNLVLIALQTQRSMRAFSLLQNANQFVLLVCTVAALLLRPTPAGLLVSRVCYSLITMLMALIYYQRVCATFAVRYPAPRSILSRVPAVSVGPYWRFGVMNALDKNVASLFTELPLQLVGILAGKAAAGYLELGFKAMTISALLTSAVFDNLQAVVPQAIGRGDYARLQQNFLRLVAAMTGAAAAFYALFALLAPLFVPLIYGEELVPAVVVIQVLAVYGAVTLIGGIFGPLYRALGLMLSALLVKIVTLLLVLFVTLRLQHPVWTAVNGAWLVNGLYVMSVVLTMSVVLPALRRRAQTEKQSP
jgi:O-antigen/teichoic acid export membrane protein